MLRATSLEIFDMIVRDVSQVEDTAPQLLPASLIITNSNKQVAHLTVFKVNLMRIWDKISLFPGK